MPYEKIGKNEPVCIADEVPFEIPERWEWVRLGSIGDWGSGATPSRTTPEYYNGNIPWLKTGDLNDGYITHIPETITERALLETSVRLNPIGSVLIAMYGATIGKLGILQTPATTNQACCACIPFTGIYNEFLFYFLMSQKLAFIKRGEGGAQPNISKEKIVATLMPLPPKAEQKRIVEKLHILQPYIESYTLLEKEDIKLHHSFPEILKKSILQYAIQGKLVPQAPTDEPASVLLERIRAEKEQLIKAGKIKRDKHESVIFRRDNSYYERVDGIERCIDDEIPFEISDSWEWCRLGELIETIDTGKSFKCEERPPDKNEYGIIKVSAVTWGTFNQEESKTCFSTSPWVKGYSIQVDDFLICRANTAALVGGCVIVDKISKRLMLSDKVLRIEFSDSISKTYVLYTLRTPFVRAQLSAAASGTSESMKNISQNAIKGLLIPFPPIKEQYRIVSKVEESLSKIKTL